MAERSGPSNFRQQAIDTANLLLEAADKLDSSSSSHTRSLSLTSLSTGQSQRDTTVSNARQRVTASSSTLRQSQLGASRPTTRMIQCGAAERERELRGLFNWTPRSAIGKRRKQGSGTTLPKSKKKKIPTWTHSFICLAQPDDDAVPDSRYRATLKQPVSSGQVNRHHCLAK